MEQVSVKSYYRIVAGIALFALLTLCLTLFFIVYRGSDLSFFFGDYFIGQMMLYLLAFAGYALTGLGIILKDKRIIAVIGFALLAVTAVIYFIKGFTDGSYIVHEYDFSSYSYYGYNDSDTFNVLCVLPELLDLAKAILLFVIVVKVAGPAKNSDPMKKIWFLPAALTVAIVIAAVLVNWFIEAVIIENGGYDGGYWNGYEGYASFWSILGYALYAVAALMIGLEYKARPVIQQTAPIAAAEPVAPVAEPQTGPAATVEPASEPAPQAAPVDWDRAVNELKAMKDLVDAGIITQEEFDAKKRQVLW